MSIYLTGSSGFVGKNIISYFGEKTHITKYKRDSVIEIREDVVLHLAGKAHDLKKVASDDEYYFVNTEFTKLVFDSFIASDANVFIILSSVKAVVDELDYELTEEYIPNPITHYGKSKLLAEQYILSKQIPNGKRVYILRPCMIHGPGNKGNLNLLYNIVKKRFPWPLGSFNNNRSFCSIENLCFIINELMINDNIQSGIYNIADDDTISTNDLINLISESQEKKTFILFIPKKIITMISILGDIFNFPLNTERLTKLTSSLVVSNNKIKKAINKPLPVEAKDGLMKTLKSFSV